MMVYINQKNFIIIIIIIIPNKLKYENIIHHIINKINSNYIFL